MVIRYAKDRIPDEMRSFLCLVVLLVVLLLLGGLFRCFLRYFLGGLLGGFLDYLFGGFLRSFAGARRSALKPSGDGELGNAKLIGGGALASASLISVHLVDEVDNRLLFFSGISLAFVGIAFSFGAHDE